MQIVDRDVSSTAAHCRRMYRVQRKKGLLPDQQQPCFTRQDGDSAAGKMSRAEGEMGLTNAAMSIAANGTPALVLLPACLGIFGSQSLPVKLQRPHACRMRSPEC